MNDAWQQIALAKKRALHRIGQGALARTRPAINQDNGGGDAGIQQLQHARDDCIAGLVGGKDHGIHRVNAKPRWYSWQVSSTPKTKAEGSTSRRLDIQGLRALAVTAVVAFHANLFIPGGFLGVDVFFVISGFVITGMLLRELGRNHRISLVDFYV